MIDLAALPAWAFSLALVLCRCSAAVSLLPGLGEAEPPPMLRVGLALSITVLVLPGVGVVPPSPGWTAASAILAELFCGFLLGWLARCVALALPMAGQAVSFMVGLSSVVAPDPALGQSSAVMRLFGLAAPILVLSTGLWALPVAALSGSYGLVPPGRFVPVADSAAAALDVVATAWGLAVRLATPFVLASVVWNVALGLLARLIPQLQIYFAAIPGQLLGGLALLGLLGTGLAEAWVAAARDQFTGLPGL